MARGGRPEGERAVCGQFGHQSVGDRAKAFVLLRLRCHVHITVDVDVIAVIVRARMDTAVVALRPPAPLWLERQFVLGPNEPALDPQAAVRRDADEHPRARHLVGIEGKRPLVERLDRGL